MKPTLDTYIISDTHFGHKNIIKYCDRPKNHDELMFNNWLNTVKTDDTVLHLGDLTFKGQNYINFNALPGDKYLMLGNHDHKSHDWYKDMGFTVTPRRIFISIGGQSILFTHRPETKLTGWNINIHGHIHDKGRIKRVGKQLYINVSVEVMNYTPVKLGEILNGL